MYCQVMIFRTNSANYNSLRIYDAINYETIYNMHILFMNTRDLLCILCLALVDIKLLNPDATSPEYGTVEVFTSNQWGSICHNGWTDADAQ